MFSKVETQAPESGLPTRVERLDSQILRLLRIKSLIPTEEDFLKYGMSPNEIDAIPGSYWIRNYSQMYKWRNAVNGIMVVLRKRDAENPEMPIDYADLREAIKILINEEPYGHIASSALDILKNQDLIYDSKGKDVDIRQAES